MNEWTSWHEKHSDKIELVAGVDCWIWTAAHGGRGYGRVSHNRKSEYAHRAAYMEAGGSFDGGPVVRHLCGNRFCVRPSHLRSGTPADNSRDTSEMFQTHSTLSVKEVRGIRQAYQRGVPLQEIADMFGIAFGSVYPIVCHRNFRHVDPSEAGGHPLRVPRKLTPSIAAEIRDRIARGDGPQSKLAAEYGVSQSVISRIRTGDRWRENFGDDTNWISWTEERI